ncbi:MAG: hypothetical protein L0H31_10560 [Nocardioidaceae bacterium]|nr:hypothetical protein [Nocardioidaceae bacterium]
MIASARGLLIAIVALSFGVLGLAASAAAIAVPSSAGAAFTYDSHDYIAFVACTTTERGPPPTYAHATDPGAVDRRSRGASARPATGTTALIITYDRPALVAHIDNATATPDRTTPERAGDLFSLQRSHVAAKSADEVLGALSYSTKIEGQLATRGWSKEAIEATIQNPTATHTVWDLTSGTKQAATAYVQRGGGYVVLNDETRAVVQISNLNKTGWKPVWEDPRFTR